MSVTATISAIIPAYNAETHLDRAIRSVLAQSRQPDEIIVIDDGSTDGTRAVVERYTTVRYMRQENQGAAAARNRGIAEAKGEWIALLDADDEWLPEKTARQMGVLENHPELRWCQCATLMCNQQEETLWALPGDQVAEIGRTGSVPVFEILRRGVPFPAGGVIIHRSVFEECGVFDTRLRINEDRDLWWRIGLRHERLGFCVQAGYRRHQDTPGSLSKGLPNRDDNLRSMCRNLRLAETCAEGVAGSFRRYMHVLAADYLMRACVGSIRVSNEAVAELRAALPLGLRTRIALKVLSCLPRPLARRLAGRWGR